MEARGFAALPQENFRNLSLKFVHVNAWPAEDNRLSPRSNAIRGPGNNLKPHDFAAAHPASIGPAVPYLEPNATQKPHETIKNN